VSEYPQFNYSSKTVTHIELLEKIQEAVGMIECTIKNITNYHALVKEKIKTMVFKKKSPNAAPNDEFLLQVFAGRHNHSTTLNKLLEFMEFLILGSGNKITFGIENIESLWRLFI